MSEKIELPQLGMGCWALGGHGYGNIEDGESRRAIEIAWASGLHMFDTADVYGFGHSEEILSAALGKHRRDALIATKGGVCWDSHGRTRKDCSPQALRNALEGSLRRLRLDCIPLYQVHWPDGRTALGEIMETMIRFRDEGKVRWFGCSNFGPGDMEDCGDHATLDTIQLPFNIMRRNQEPFMKACRTEELRTVAYDVLARGLLAGKFDKSSTWGERDTRSTDSRFHGDSFSRAQDVVAVLRRIGDRIGQKPYAVAIRWALQTEAVDCALVGCRTIGQVRDNVSVLSWSLGPDDIAEIDTLEQLGPEVET